MKMKSYVYTICLLGLSFSSVLCLKTTEETLKKHEIENSIEKEHETSDIVKRQDVATTEEAWTGRWLPERTTTAPKHFTDAINLHDDLHGVKMGISSENCDDGNVNITLDWDMSPVNYTCYNPSHLFIPNVDLPALLETETIPEGYVPAHLCLTSPIHYDHPVPTFGDHRPLWPKYGEYKFLPRQRWLHSIEHGAIVMLYHPCANPVEVNRLRKLVFTCIRRHIITPHTLLDEQRPMALVAWGTRLTMSIVDPDVVRAFIREKSKHGFEGSDSRDGQYEFQLEVPSVVPLGSDIDDTVICPYQ